MPFNSFTYAPCADEWQLVVSTANSIWGKCQTTVDMRRQSFMLKLAGEASDGLGIHGVSETRLLHN